MMRYEIGNICNIQSHSVRLPISFRQIAAMDHQIGTGRIFTDKLLECTVLLVEYVDFLNIKANSLNSVAERQPNFL